MKKRFLAIVLLAALLTAVVPLPAQAAVGTNGLVPIYIGDNAVDYLADLILSEIPLQGKSTREQIQAVYDWVILHCERENWDGTYYFNEEEVRIKAEAYGKTAETRLAEGSAVLRPEWSAHYGVNPGDTYDMNYRIARNAYEMMLKRTGNCVHFSSLLAVLLGHLGFDCRMVAGDFINNAGSYIMHKWNYLLVDGQYYWLDVRIDHSYYKSTGYIPHSFFMVSDTAVWEKHHSWNHIYTDLLCEKSQEIARFYAHTHKIVKAEAVVPTCETDGCHAHYECTICGAYFADALGEQSLQTSAVVLPAFGHDWGEWVILKEPTQLEYGIRQRICKTDASHVQTEKLKALGNPFDDVPAGCYYETPVAWAFGKEITNGTAPQEYQPQQPCTRAQVVTFLWRAAGKPIPEADLNPFADIFDSSYYYTAVLWAAENGIALGTAEDTFSPNDTCTRAQVVTFLCRAVGNPAPQSAQNRFTDVAEESYYYAAVLWASEQGIALGTSESAFSPEQTCTRAQVVTFLYRSLK